MVVMTLIKTDCRVAILKTISYMTKNAHFKRRHGGAAPEQWEVKYAIRTAIKTAVADYFVNCGHHGPGWHFFLSQGLGGTLE
jgi:hypothetical protein